MQQSPSDCQSLALPVRHIRIEWQKASPRAGLLFVLRSHQYPALSITNTFDLTSFTPPRQLLQSPHMLVSPDSIAGVTLSDP